MYGTIDNRAYLKGEEITSNIPFYNESTRETRYYGLRDFEISKDFKQFKFNEKDCMECPLKEQCLYRDKNGKLFTRGRRVDVPMRYEIVLADRESAATSEFEEACNKRFIFFSTLALL